MRARVLPFEEWHRLDESLYPILMTITPEESRICVVEDGDEIVAHWFLVPVVHADGAWIHPRKRKDGKTIKKLIQIMQVATADMGVDRVWSNPDNEESLNALLRLGAIASPTMSVVLKVS